MKQGSGGQRERHKRRRSKFPTPCAPLLEATASLGQTEGWAPLREGKGNVLKVSVEDSSLVQLILSAEFRKVTFVVHNSQNPLDILGAAVQLFQTLFQGIEYGPLDRGSWPSLLLALMAVACTEAQTSQLIPYMI